MKTHLFLLFLTLTFSMTTAFSQSQAEMNLTAQAELEKVDAQLNKIYRKLISENDPESNKRLRETQRTWLKFVELHLQYVFPLEEGQNPQEVYGSIYHLEYATLKTRLFTERVQQLSDQ